MEELKRWYSPTASFIWLSPGGIRLSASFIWLSPGGIRLSASDILLTQSGIAVQWYLANAKLDEHITFNHQFRRN